MTFKLFWYFLFRILQSMFEPPPEINARSLDSTQIEGDDYADLDELHYNEQYRERGFFKNAFEKLKSFLEKLNPFRHFTLINYVRNLPDSESELTEAKRQEMLELIKERIEEPDKAGEILLQIFQFIKTGRRLAQLLKLY